MYDKMRSKPFLLIIFAIAGHLLFDGGIQIASAQQFSLLHTFSYLAQTTGATNTDGGQPVTSLVGSSNFLYGTTQHGGTNGNGTIFRMNSDGSSFTTLYTFRGGTNGYQPHCSLALSDDTLYGALPEAGRFGYGTLFKIKSDGTGFTNFYLFGGTTNGSSPTVGLIISSNTIYGKALGPRPGMIFKINTNGTGFSKIHQFSATTYDPVIFYDTNYDGIFTDGDGELILSDNTLYGVASHGGPTGGGTVFRVNTDGSGFNVVHAFYHPPTNDIHNIEGLYPFCRLALSSNVLYGTTSEGGTSGWGVIFKVGTDGSNFAVLYNFPSSNPPGANFGFPKTGVFELSDVLYGANQQGGDFGFGSIFKIHFDGTGFAEIYKFTRPLCGNYCTGPYGTNYDGAYSIAKGSLAYSGGRFYATASGGGIWGNGTVFALDPSPSCSILRSGAKAIVSWGDSGFDLQCAPDLAETFTNVPGATSPYTNDIDAPQQFFRLKVK